MVYYRGTYEDARECKDWPWKKVSFCIRGKSDEQIKKLVQFAFDNYFLCEAKEIHFGSCLKRLDIKIEEVED